MLEEERNYNSWIVPIDVARMLYVRGFFDPILFVYEDGNLHTHGESESLTAGEWRTDYFELDLDEFWSYEEADYRLDRLPAATYEQAFKWLMDRGIYGEISKIPKVNAWVYNAIDESELQVKMVTGEGDDYEKVRLECLIKCIEFVKVL